MSKDLKPCPFCGEKAGEILYEPFLGMYSVDCMNCLKGTKLKTSRLMAIRAWNYGKKQSFEQNSEDCYE